MKAVMGFAFFLLFLAGIAFVTLQGRQQLANMESRQANLNGTSWSAASIGKQPVPDDPEMYVSFEQDGKITGHGGCNRFFGALEQSESGFTIGPLGSTRMACPEPIMQREFAFLEALQNMKSYAIDNGVLRVLDESGNVIAELKRR